MKEEEIRPQRIFDEYLRLCEQDTRAYFLDVVREEVDCPACGAVGELAFRKHNFTYKTCPRCLTLYVSPRPAADAFAKYYTDSPSAKYWATTFYKETAPARREKIWKPKAQMVREAMQRFDAAGRAIVDIGGGYGLFAEEMREVSGGSILVIEPSHHLANACRDKSLLVIEEFLEHVGAIDLPSGPKVFVSFELFEHLHSPASFLKHLGTLMGKGDLFLFTTLSGLGVDIQVLWENSKSISPPHHLNFLNPSSVRLLLDRIGMETLEITTPGRLDVDILVNNLHHIKDQFWRSFALSATETVREEWQRLIAASGWSSHMMVICRKA